MKAIRIERGTGSGLESMAPWIGIVAMIAAFGFLYVWQQIQTRDLKRDILQLENTRNQRAKENSRLQVNVAQLASQDTVYSSAVGLFQLDFPQVGQVITIAEHDPILTPTTHATPVALPSPSR